MRCLHPIQIKNKNGEYQLVPCRRCYACLNRRRVELTDLANEETLHHKYVMFVTLTYANEHLPVAVAVRHKVDDRLTWHVHPHGRLAVDDFVSDWFDATVSYDKKIQDFFSRPRLNFKPEGVRSNAHPFGVLLKSDFQKFNKRLRERLYRNYGEKVRFFACGEYGPQSFRPHFHAVYYFSDDSAAKGFADVVSQSWRYGRVDCQLSAGKGVERYVAGYVNSLVRVPAFLKRSSLKPFYMHSAYFGTLSHRQSFKSLSDLDFRSVAKREYRTNDGIKSASSPLSFQTSLFPRCYQYGNSDSFFRFLRYTLVGAIQKDCEEFKGIPWEDFERLSWSDICSFYDNPYDWSRPFVSGYCLDDLFAGSRITSLADTLYRHLCVSRCFMRNCSRFHCSPLAYLRALERYYEQKDYQCLLSHFREQVEMLSRGASPVDLVHCYDNIPMDYGVYRQGLVFQRIFSMFVQSLQENGVEIEESELYDRYYDVETRFNYHSDYDAEALICENNVKHRELNDLNKYLE